MKPPIPAANISASTACVWNISELAKPNVIVMHPGPINRGREISSDVADSQRSVILNQVENGIAVRMAVLEKVICDKRMANSNQERPGDGPCIEYRSHRRRASRGRQSCRRGPELASPEAEVFDATGLIVAPGLYRYARAPAGARL